MIDIISTNSKIFTILTKTILVSVSDLFVFKVFLYFVFSKDGEIDAFELQAILNSAFKKGKQKNLKLLTSNIYL